MITILDGKLTIPENERFIGFAGDNLNRTIEFLLVGATKADRIYRIYLTFDDGTVNYFVLPSKTCEQGVVLSWDVLTEHIFKSGLVCAQIKAFTASGVVYHTTSDTFIVGDSAELSDTFLRENSEFLEYEKKLNYLAQTVSDVCVMMPYIGDNGNWYIYNADKGVYIDSGKPSRGEISPGELADGAVTTSKLAPNAVSSAKLASNAVTADKLGQYAVGNVAIAPGAVSEEKLSNAAVTSSKIAEGAVSSDHLTDACIRSKHIEDNAVTAEKLAFGVIDSTDKFSDDFVSHYLSLPVTKVSASGIFTDSFYDSRTTPGIYQMDSHSGTHQVLVVLKPDSDSHLMQLRMSVDKVEYRGIWCTEDGVYTEEDWTPWQTFDFSASIVDISHIATELILESNMDYRLSRIEGVVGLTLKLPDSMPDDFECSLVFRSGDDTATSITCPSFIKWSGEDVESVTTTENGAEVTYNCLVPKANKTYNVIFWYDGFNVNAVSRGVTNG